MSSTLPILGRFQLIEPLAQGGMASVWRAVHREQGVPAAVKVLGARANAGLADALRAETRAMARLEHPHIVSVFDQGEVDARAAALSDDRLAVGSPWVAMELVEGVTLGKLYRNLRWPTLATLLVQLLEALAHAHAAGVVHRDIKLTNILWGPDGAKLMDFGIAYAMRQHEEQGRVHTLHAGTPRYMAPEQLAERLDDQGPWTDLFAVGVLAWRLSSRSAPFPDDAQKAREAKQRGHFEPFVPRFALPSGFPGWCARLLSPRPEDRFSHAADAVHHLFDIVERTVDAAADEATEIVLPPRDPPPVPRTWRPATHWRRPVELVGCGLRLFGLRDAPFIGRHGLRDALWKSLHSAVHTRTPRVVVLRGPSGYGKSSIARWLARRAEEVGAATSLRTRWSDEVQPGLPGLLARRYRCLGLPADGVRERVQHHLANVRPTPPPGEAGRLVQLLCPGEPLGPDGEELTTDDRFGLVTRAIQRSAQQRAAVVWFDDAHANPESFVYPLSMLGTPDLPILFVLTVQEEALVGSTSATIALEELTSQPGVSTFNVGKLRLEDQRELVQGLLRLEPSLADRVARRTDGNPLFASQLLEDWVSRDLMELSVDGFRLRDTLAASLPESLGQVWNGRVSSLLEETDPTFGLALELAATLGSYVDREEWALVCEAAGTAAHDALLEALLQRHLATLEAGGWHFIHGMLREAILQRAGREGRLSGHHLLVGRTLSGRPGVAVRVGRHLLQGAAGFEAIDPLEDGAEEATRSGDYEEAMRLLRARTALMRQLKTPPTDARWGRGRVALAEILARLDRWEEAAGYAEQAAADAREHGWARVEVEALMLLVENRSVTDLGRARDLLERAFDVAERPGNEDTLAAVYLLASEVHRRSGDLHGALLTARRALAHLVRAGGIRRARVEIAIVQTLLKLGKLEDAQRHLHRAEQLADRQQHPFDQAVCAYLRANLGRIRGDLATAEEGYREATDRFAALGDANAWTMRAYLGVVLAQRGDVAAAEELFKLVLRSRSQLGDLLAHLGSLLCTADAVDPLPFGSHVKAVERFVQRGWCDPLAAEIAEDAAKRAYRAGFAQRARILLGLSHRQRERLAMNA